MALPLGVALPLAFLLGSIPFGLLLVRILTGQDLRKVGSGNIGATNASRAFGEKARLPVFVLIYLLDASKGLVPTLFFLAPGSPLGARVLVGLVAILGHCFSPFLGFKGGKGVATTSGVLLALDWPAFLVGILAFFVVFGITRVVALGSLALGLGLALGIIFEDPTRAFGERLPLTSLGLFLALFLFWTHRSNLRKLLAARRA
ncbi:MAG TPA: glycerol-3-phosphate 1-O-acyltransferase [Planctomycetes bacterium]|nr:glycerol-3-phosphate 1-O-acyltransferase [Planctomycetota bacterium]